MKKIEIKEVFLTRGIVDDKCLDRLAFKYRYTKALDIQDVEKLIKEKEILEKISKLFDEKLVWALKIRGKLINKKLVAKLREKIITTAKCLKALKTEVSDLEKQVSVIREFNEINQVKTNIDNGKRK